MRQLQSYRNNGAKGALLDEYEKALNELILLIENISSAELLLIIDENTTDEDCRSIQTILSHVVQSGYTYVVEIRKALGEEVTYREKVFFDNSQQYINALKEMFEYNERLFEEHPLLPLEEYNPNNKMQVRWGQLYDVEQLYEHAIVHVLRHRRQIEKIKCNLK